ncbi:hypothetical protein KY290_011680 [Solanum tuberosum]|uniref:Phytocyanin domain-containing protein n=1 Tax=Solanum tuberosum TaxID=4113 RepID=A0ABQ7W1D8_SOLTU|nr:hypothetical protein KY290_011680 [Solanum tuberosum]
MAQQRHVVVLLVLACLFTSSYSYQYTVGGKDGWVLNPSVDYNTWSQHMRFIINDSVCKSSPSSQNVKYKQGADSVLEVSKDDYDKCNTGNPIKKMEDGNSIFTLDRSGPFYFISGNKDNCDKGQKLQIIVISVRNQTPAPGVAPPSNGSTTPSPMGSPPSTGGSSPAASPPKGSSTPGTPSAPGVAPPSNGSTTPSPTGSPPSTGGSSPAASPPKGSSTPGTPSAPSANAPAGSSSPGASSPNGAPVSTPAGKSPTPSGSTASPPAPATGGSVAPAMSPVANGPSTSTPGSSSPVAGGPSSGSGIAPSAGGPSGSGMAPSAGGPAGSMSPGPSAGGPLAGGPSAGAPGSSASGPGGSNTPADINSPAGAPENPNSFAVKAFTPSIVLVSAVSLVLTVALGEFIILPWGKITGYYYI